MRINSVLLFLLVVTPWLIASPQGQEKPDKAARTIGRPQGTSIRSLLRSTDEIVVVKDGIAGPPLEVAFSNDDERAQYEWELLSHRENALLLTRVESVNSSFDSTESWITSTARMRVLEILSPGNLPLDGKWGDVTIDTKNRLLTIDFDGGEIRLGKALISAGEYSVWEPKAKYLISFRVVPDEKSVHIGIVYQISSDEKLTAQKRSRGSAMLSPHGLRGRELSDVRKLIARF
jgi:hypothetical protein